MRRLKTDSRASLPVQAEVAQYQWATQTTNAALISSLVAQGKYVWQAFGAQDSVIGGPPASPTGCSAWMRAFCAPAAQGAPLMMAMAEGASRNQSVAAFLVVRPPYGCASAGARDGVAHARVPALPLRT